MAVTCFSEWHSSCDLRRTSVRCQEKMAKYYGRRFGLSPKRETNESEEPCVLQQQPKTNKVNPALSDKKPASFRDDNDFDDKQYVTVAKMPNVGNVLSRTTASAPVDTRRSTRLQYKVHETVSVSADIIDGQKRAATYDTVTGSEGKKKTI